MFLSVIVVPLVFSLISYLYGTTILFWWYAPNGGAGMCVYPAPSDACSKKVGVAVSVSFDVLLPSVASAGTEKVKPFLMPTVGDPLGL